MGFKLRFEKPFIKDNTERTTKAEADILLNAQKIALRVEKQTFDALEDSVEDQWAELAVQAMLISNKVSATDYNGITIASLINQSASTVKVQAQHIQLEGLVTVNEKFKVLADGSIEAVNAKLSGAITATKMVSPNSQNYYGEIGLTDGSAGLGLFDLRYGIGAYFEVYEIENGNGFILRDKANINRFEAAAAVTQMRDVNNKTAYSASATTRTVAAPNGTTYLSVTNQGVQIVKNGAVIAWWGY